MASEKFMIHSEYPYMTAVMKGLLTRAIARGLPVLIEGSTGFVLTVETSRDVKVITGADLGLNSSAANRLSQDKFFTEFYLKNNDLQTFASLLLESESATDCSQIIYPCVVKPNKGSSGAGVSVVFSKEFLPRAVVIASEIDSLVLIQQFCRKPEYRIVVLAEQVLYSYKKWALEIIGDGKSSIEAVVAQLADNKKQKIDLNSPETKLWLANNNYSARSVLACGERLNLAPVANVYRGGNVQLVENIAAEYLNIACKAAQKIGLHYAGIDIFADTLDEFDPGYRIIEVNANPGFEGLQTNAELHEQVLDSIAIKLFDS